MTNRSKDAEVRILADPASTADALARFLVKEIRRSVDRSGRCKLALSGGGTPRLLYERLAQADLAGSVPWDAVHLYWSDERCVPPDDASSNYAMARDALIRHLPLEAAQVHPVKGDLPPESAAADYEVVLGKDPLDIVLLGMGGDGHTASLFPGGPELHPRGEDETRVAIATRSPLPPPDRVSLSLHAINRARCVVFFVVGADKASRLAQVMTELEDAAAPTMQPALQPETQAATLPAAMVRPDPGTLCWYLDRAAARALPTGSSPD